MPTPAIAIGGGVSLIGSLIGGSDADETQTQTKDTTENVSRTNKYSPYYTNAEKSAIGTNILGKINKNWLSGNNSITNTLASRGLTGGVAKSAMAGSERKRNEAISGSLSEIENEANKKLLMGYFGSGTSSGTAESESDTGVMSGIGGSLGGIGGTLAGAGLLKYLKT